MNRALVALAFIAGLAFTLLARGEDEGVATRPIRISEITEEAEKAIVARWKTINEELEALDRSKLADDDWAKEWAGVYYTGGGPGQSISIAVAPESGIAYTCSGCLGLADAKEGEIIERAADGLRIKWGTNPTREDSSISEKLYFVRWGDRRYLVPEKGMKEFIRDYNFGGDNRIRMSSGPLQYHDEEQFDRQTASSCPPGVPKLPPEFAKLIIKKAARLVVKKIQLNRPAQKPGDVVEVRGRATLTGATKGLPVGTRLLYRTQSADGWVELTKVDGSITEGTIFLKVYTNQAKLPSPGYEFVLPGAAPEAKE